MITDLRVPVLNVRPNIVQLQRRCQQAAGRHGEEKEKDEEHETLVSLVVEERGRATYCSHLCISTVLMSWQCVCEHVCVCITHHAIALAATTAHLAACYNKGAQLIRSQSEGKA